MSGRDQPVIPGALVLSRNSLEWRCDPASRWRHPEMTGRDQPVISGCRHRDAGSQRHSSELRDSTRAPGMTGWSRPLILICNEGFQSSLAAATLHRLGLANATDLDGGFVAWAAASLPLMPGPAAQAAR